MNKEREREREREGRESIKNSLSISVALRLVFPPKFWASLRPLPWFHIETVSPNLVSLQESTSGLHWICTKNVYRSLCVNTQSASIDGWMEEAMPGNV